jgi:hypothetical protein
LEQTTLIIAKGVAALIGLLVVILQKNKISEIVNLVKSTRKNRKLVDQSITFEQIDKIVADVAKHYGADRGLYYFFHNGVFTINSISLKKVSVLSEYHILDLSSNKKDQQGLPIAMLSGFLKEYILDRMIKCRDRNNYTGNVTSLKTMLESMNVRSTYSNVVKDSKGLFIGVLVLNGELNELNIEDFKEFEYAKRRIVELLAN